MQTSCLERRVLTVQEFCAVYAVGRTKLYELWAENAGPPRFKLGSRTYISAEDADCWFTNILAAFAVSDMARNSPRKLP